MALDEGYLLPWQPLHNLMGYLPSGLNIVAAGTGIGKTTYLAELARQEAYVRADRAPVCVVPTELKGEDWWAVVIAAHVGLRREQVKFRQEFEKLPAETQRSVQGLLQKFRQNRNALDLWIPQVPRVVTVGVVRPLMRQLRERGGRLFILDHLDHVEPDNQDAKRRSSAERYAAAACELTEAAQEEGVVLVAAAQLNRSGSSAVGSFGAAELGDLANSRHFEANAETVMVMSASPNADLSAEQFDVLKEDMRRSGNRGGRELADRELKTFARLKTRWTYSRENAVEMALRNGRLVDGCQARHERGLPLVPQGRTMPTPPSARGPGRPKRERV